MQIVRIGNRYRVKDCVPRLDNFWIDADPERNEINIPATGDIGPATAADLVRAIQYAVDLANGLITLEPTPPAALERQDWHDEVIAELRNGRKIEAIKRCRWATGLSLKEAKTMVERIQAEHRL